MRLFANADAAQIPIANESVHSVVTSPPYWSLRKYSGEQTRRWPAVRYFPMSGMAEIEVPEWEGALGLEPTPEMHVGHIVVVMREVYRVLRDDGVAWLNYGDSYAGSWGNYGSREGGQRERTTDALDRPAWDVHTTRPPTSLTALAAGNLMLIPHRVALALQADGWIVRNDCVWHKKNPMPESCAGTRWERGREKKSRSGHAKEHNIKGGHKKMLEDASVHQGIGPHWLAEYEYGEGYELRTGSWRHTRAHEFVFMLTKQMGYWSDQEAVREANVSGEEEWAGSYSDQGSIVADNWRENPTKNAGKSTRRFSNKSGRNPRSVFSLSTEPYKHAHYATYPRSLIAPLMLATCPRRCCPECGKGWAAVVDREKGDRDIEEERRISAEATGRTDGKTVPAGGGNERWDKKTILGYRPTCECPEHEPVPGIVLDLFVGSGTTLQVAKEIGVHGIGLDLSYDYLRDQARLRVEKVMPRNALDGLPLFEEEQT